MGGGAFEIAVSLPLQNRNMAGRASSVVPAVRRAELLVSNNEGIKGSKRDGAGFNATNTITNNERCQSSVFSANNNREVPW